MSYLQLQDKNRGQSDLAFCYKKIRDNNLLRLLQHNNYQFINYSIFNFEGQPARVNETFLPVKTRLITSQTFLSRINRDIRFNLITKWKSGSELRKLTYSTLHNNNNIYKLTWNIANEKSTRPKFVYSHLMMPHYPYYYDENDLDKYKNESASGTRGLEIDYKFKSSGWYAAINYSFYSIANHSEISTYSVPGHPNNHLAFPSHKVNLNCNINLSHTINVNPSFSYMSTRYSASHTDAGVLTSREISPSLYANISLNFDDVIKKGLHIQLACFNMFDNSVFYIQPYDGNHEPLPGAGRE